MLYKFYQYYCLNKVNKNSFGGMTPHDMLSEVIVDTNFHLKNHNESFYYREVCSPKLTSPACAVPHCLTTMMSFFPEIDGRVLQR